MTERRSTRAVPAAADRLRSLPHRTYRLRALGMGLGALPLAVVLRELDAAWPAWAWVAFGCLAWPHLAYALATRSRDPFHAELRNLVFDSVFAATTLPLMRFNLLPSVVLVTVSLADKVNSGIRGLWLRSLPFMLGAILVVGATTGFELRWATSTDVMLACVPIIVIHTLAVSLNSYKLVRRVQAQNVKLDELARLDAVTGLDSRRHWQSQAEARLARHRELGEPASLVLVDLDRFKDINDRYGHATGDDVLRGVADAIRRHAPEGSEAGRLGGDEFAVAMPVRAAEAIAFAEQLRTATAALSFARFPALRCAISVGVAEAPGPGVAFREWIEAADRAMYADKAARGSVRAAAK